MIQDSRGKRVTVMGLAGFGGGVGVTRWLAAAARIGRIFRLTPVKASA